MKYTLLICALVASCLSYGIDFGRVMVTGDSNVAGAGGDAPNSFRYPLHQKLGLAGHTKDFVGPAQWGSFPDGVGDNQHAGFGGWGMYSTLTGLHPTTNANLGKGKYSEWLTSHTPDTVVFLSGINDYFRWGTTYTSNPNAPAEAEAFFRSSFETLFDQTFAANSNMNMVVLGYHQTEYTDGTNESRNAMLEDLNVLLATMEIEQRGIGRNVTYVDLFSLTSIGGHTHDGVHLNAFGANLVADATLAGMTEGVPEPATMVILGLGALACMRRKAQLRNTRA